MSAMETEEMPASSEAPANAEAAASSPEKPTDSASAKASDDVPMAERSSPETKKASAVVEAGGDATSATTDAKAESKPAPDAESKETEADKATTPSATEPPPSAAEPAADSTAPAATNAPAAEADIDHETEAELADAVPAPIPASVPSAAQTKANKKRARSPDVAGMQQQVVSAASAAAAAQLCFSMGLSGLHSLLTAATITSANQSSGSGGSPSLPTKEQVRQAAVKAVQECPPHMHLSKTDSAPQLKLVDDRRLHVKGGMRGYRMTRATHGVSAGHYYYEAIILDPPPISEIVAGLPSNARLGKNLQAQIQQALRDEKEGVKTPSSPTFGGHVRLGFSMRTGDLQAPVGYDKWSFGIRDIGGSKIHCSHREDHWGGEEFGPGDVIGCAICLVNEKDSADMLSGRGPRTTGGSARNFSSARGMPGYGGPTSSSQAGGDGGPGDTTATGTNGSTVATMTGKANHIRFFKNGAPMGQFVISKGKTQGGVAFDVPSGVYYPAISLYMGATVKFNPGPHFVCQPRKLPTGIKMKPISEYIKPPITVDEALTKSQKEKPFRKPDLLQTFQDLVRTEAQVLQDSYASHLEQHVKDVYAERKKRNLNVSDLEDAMEAYRQPEQEQKPQEMAMDDKQEEKRGQADGKDATKIDGVNSGKSDAMET